MSPFEVRYGRECKILINWNNLEDKLVLGPKMLANMEQVVKKFRQNLKVAQVRQKVYVDKKKTYREFQVGDHVYLRVKPRKSTLHWGGCAKLAPYYCGPFQILERIKPVAYKLALPGHIQVHYVFHVSLLKKYMYDPRHVIDWHNVQVEPDKEMLLEPLRILEQREMMLQRRDITQVKVQWKYFSPKEAIWEDEKFMRRAYPELF
eukprot:PITA_32322